MNTDTTTTTAPTIRLSTEAYTYEIFSQALYDENPEFEGNYILKYYVDGKPLWAYRKQDPEINFVVDIEPVKDGLLIFACSEDSSKIVKWSNTGVLQWEFKDDRLDIEPEDYWGQAYFAKTDSNGNLYVTAGERLLMISSMDGLVGWDISTKPMFYDELKKRIDDASYILQGIVVSPEDKLFMMHRIVDRKALSVDKDFADICGCLTALDNYGGVMWCNAT